MLFRMSALELKEQGGLVVSPSVGCKHFQLSLSAMLMELRVSQFHDGL